MKYVYILKTGETFPATKANLGDFDRWVAETPGKKRRDFRTVAIEHGEPFPLLPSAKGFIITGSHAMVTDELGWSVALEKYIRRIVSDNIPLLGICYGHQLIAKALGGKSDYNPKGKEIGTVGIRTLDRAGGDPLLTDLPKTFCAYVTHAQSVLKLPPRAEVLAKNAHDAHQIVRFAPRCWGVQIHPEFNGAIMTEYILRQKEELLAMRFDVDRLLREVKACRASRKILDNFLAVVDGPSCRTP